MNKIVAIAITAILGLAGVFFVTQNDERANLSTNSGAALSMQTIMDDVSKGGQLIDVRTATEYESGHIDGAINLSLQDIRAGIMPTITKDKPLYVYCQSGNRSSQATAAFKAAGYKNIIDLGAITHVQSIGGVIKS